MIWVRAKGFGLLLVSKQLPEAAKRDSACGTVDQHLSADSSMPAHLEQKAANTGAHTGQQIKECTLTKNEQPQSVGRHVKKQPI